jgi:signal transduction histidine kinase
VLLWTFDEPRTFDAAERQVLAGLAAQCAQALERARLHAAEAAARRAAEAANRAKSDFLAVMSHELRTPLNAIAGYAQLLEMGLHGPVTGPQRDALARVQRSQRHLLGLINDVLNYAKLEAGRVDYRLAPVALADAVADLAPMIEPQLAAKGLTYAVAVPAGLVAHADPEKLGQVLLNLLSNAVKFTPAGGRVEVGSAAGGTIAGRAAVRLFVRDSGVGIAADQLARIFEPFVQVDQRLTRTEEGTGLGLAISRDLARGMGGDLTAQSAPGAGSTFVLTLPAA